MAVHTASAVWNGKLQDGQGTMKLGSGAFEGKYSFRSRFEDGGGTNPEELIGAAHAGCFSMALAFTLGEAGHSPQNVATSAVVNLEKVADGFAITTIELNCEADVPGIGEEEFLKFADQAKQGCPVSKALAGVEIKLNAKLRK